MKDADKMRSRWDRIHAALNGLDQRFALGDVIGLVVGVIVGRGTLGTFTSSPQFLVGFYLSITAVALFVGVLRGAKLVLRMAVWALYVTMWITSLAATAILGIALGLLLGQVSWSNVGIFSGVFFFYLYIAYSKYSMKRVIAKI